MTAHIINRPMTQSKDEIKSDWQLRAAGLAKSTVLTPRQAEVCVLTECADKSREEIADILGISINTVDEHRREYRQRIKKSDTV